MARQQPSPTLWLPKYATARHFIRIMDGTSYSTYRTMWNEITSQAGNKQITVNWTEPDSWIPERLAKADDSRRLAFRIWQESENSINPRWSYENWRFVNAYRLLEIQNDTFVQSKRGERFVAGDETTISEIDQNEMLLFLLGEVADKGSGARRDFIGAYATLCQRHTTWKDSSIASSFSSRLQNLAARNLITVKGRTYQITDEGLAHLQGVIGGDERSALGVQLLANEKNGQARQQLREFLQTMDPFEFEHLIRHLLVEMGYDAAVTAPTNDKGVDVVADIELGISRVREAVQVKRHKDNVGSPVLSQLRGSLWQFNAVRGSIFTTGGFTKGAQDTAFVPNVPPITLIDGERLLDLLIEHNIGIRRREIKILEFDEASLSQFETEDGSDPQ